MVNEYRFHELCGHSQAEPKLLGDMVDWFTFPQPLPFILLTVFETCYTYGDKEDGRTTDARVTTVVLLTIRYSS